MPFEGHACKKNHPEPGKAIWIAILLALIASAGNWFPSTSAFTFGVPQTLNAPGASTGARVAADGQNVFAAWVQSSTIFVANSINGGTFSTPIQVSVTGTTSTNPRIAASGDSVYVAWVVTSVGSEDIYFAKGTVSGGTLSMSAAIALSNNPGTSEDPQLSVSGSNVVVVWEETVSGFKEIFFAFSTDGGVNFDTSATNNLSASASVTSESPSIVVSGSDVFVAWDENDNVSFIATAFFGKGTISGGSLTFSSPQNLSSGINCLGLAFAQSPKVQVSGTNVLVVWLDGLCSNIYYAQSADGGTSFDVPADSSDNRISSSGSAFAFDAHLLNTSLLVTWTDSGTGLDIFFAKGTVSAGSLTVDYTTNLSATAGSASSQPRIASSGSNVYVVWQEGSPNDIFLSVSTDGGSTAPTGSVNISSNSGQSSVPDIATSGINLYTIWVDNTSGSNDILFKLVADQPASISIASVGSTTPRWGLDPAQVNGLVAGDSTDTIEISWGDGSTDSIGVTGSSWGPVSHTYASAATGAMTITARLLDSSMVEKASATLGVNVQKHATALTIGSIMSVVKGSGITAAGALTDTDASVTIDGKTITFTGTGATGLSPAATASGAYSSTGASPGTASPLLSVQAHFAGDGAYIASDSATVFYDTVETDTLSFAVPAGAPSGPIALTDFGASILFDNVTTPGSVFVSACDSPASTRYLELDTDLCLTISPALTMAPSSFAHVTVSYAGKTIPAGHTEDEVSIFHNGPSGIVDITESRNVDLNTVTGRTSSFSSFVVGVALHDPLPAGALRKQLFVGDNDITFDFTQSKAISLGGGSTVIGGGLPVTVIDPSKNLNGAVAETVAAKISSTSDPTGITINLTEVGPNAGLFTGNFFVSGSGSSDNILHADVGDSLQASYGEFTAPFRVVIEDVIEAGALDLVGYAPPNFIDPVGDSYGLVLRDASLAAGATISPTMSYANAMLMSGDNPANIRMFRMDGTACKAEITLTGGAGHNPAQKTLTGTTTVLGQYTLGLNGPPAPGLCPADPGGGGGGLPRPGSGLVLDAVAAVVQGSSSSSTSSGGSSGPAPSGSASSVVSSPQVSSSNESTTANVGGETVNVSFESVQGSGTVSVTSMSISQQAGLFSQVAGTGQGAGSVGGSQFSTAGTLFDVSTTASYSGPVQVTIPYSESLVSDEQNVRFLHHSADGWEDATISIDTQSNTVTGRVTSLSPVVAGVVDDGTFGSAYFAVNPLHRVSSDITVGADELPPGLLANIPETGSPITVSATIKNAQRVNQTYAFIVQITDGDGITKSVTWQKGTLERGQSASVSSSWLADVSSEYKVQVFVWDSVGKRAMPLSEGTVMQVTA